MLRLRRGAGRGHRAPPAGAAPSPATGLSGERDEAGATNPPTASSTRTPSGDQQMFDIFAVLILAGAALAAFNLATRIVEAQRREIGIGMALGVPPRELAIRPLLLGVQIAVAGTLLGLALGLMMGGSSAASSKTCCRCRRCGRPSSSASSPAPR